MVLLGNFRFAGFFLGALNSSIASLAGVMLSGDTGDKSSQLSDSRGLVRARSRRVASATKVTVDSTVI